MFETAMGSGQEEPPVRWAIAGFGAGGRVFHAPLIRATKTMRLEAVVASAKHAGCRELASASLVPDLQEVAQMGIQGVTITTPAGTHEKLAHAALDLGLHVVVDKPFAVTAKGARSLVAHAQHAGRRLSVYQNRRWDGDFLTLAEIVAGGELGQIYRFHSRIQRFHPDLPQWNTDAPAAEGGGTLLDLGPHLIDQAVVLFGVVESVFAELIRIGDGPGAENDVLLILRHATGTTSVVEVSVVAASQGPRFQINGSRGGVTIDGFDIQESDLFEGRTPELLGCDWGRDETRRATVITEAGTDARHLKQGAWTGYYPAMANAIRRGLPVPVDPRSAIHTSAVIDAARLSSTHGVWANVTLDCHEA